MISWIQNYIIRKGRFVALGMLAVVIVAFVFTIGNTPGCTTNQSGYEEELFYGIDLNSPLERDIIVEKTLRSAFLNGRQFRTEEQFQSALMSRVALLHLADEIGVPAPTSETLAEFIRTKAAFLGPNGEFSADAYTNFVDSVESNPSVPKGLVIQVLNEDYRVEQVQSALSGPGYMLPSEVIAQARSSQTEYTVSVAEIAYETFTPELDPTEEELTAYFEATQQRYEIPERIKANYVQFASADFADQVSEATDSDLRQHFAEGRAQFVADFEAANPPAEDSEEPATVTFDDVRDAVAASFASAQANRLANQAAQAFAYQLYYDNIGRDSAGFNQLLNETGVSLIEIEPYTAAEARQRMLSPEMLESAFNLSGSRYYSDAYAINGGFGVLIYEGRLAPEIPPYADVSAQVKINFLAEEKRRLFSEKGENLKAELAVGIEAGTPFAELAESLELSSQSFDPFTPSEAPSDLNRSALSQAQRMQVGEVSPMLTVGGTGIFVYLASKEVPEIDPASDDLAESQDMLERWAAFSTQSDLVNELIVQGLPESTQQ